MRVNVKYQVVELDGSHHITDNHKTEFLFRDTLYIVYGSSCARDAELQVERHLGEQYIGDFIYSENTKAYYKKWLKRFDRKGLSGLSKDELFQMIKDQITVGAQYVK